MKHPQKIRDRIEQLNETMDKYRGNTEYSNYVLRCVIEKQILNAVLYDLDFAK